MIPRDVKSPTAPIPFHKLLKVVAIVDPHDDQTKQLLHHIAAENFQIEVSDNYERDVSEDADTGDVLRGLANLPGRCGISA
jgi:ornithine decarboxylase